MPGNDWFDGSDFNDYETPYSVASPPTGHCPCHACAGDHFACSTQLATASPDKNPIPFLDAKRAASICNEKSMPFSQTSGNKALEYRSSSKCPRSIGSFFELSIAPAHGNGTMGYLGNSIGKSKQFLTRSPNSIITMRVVGGGQAVLCP